MADIIHKPTKSEFKRMAVHLGYARLRELAEADKAGRVVVLRVRWAMLCTDSTGKRPYC